MPVVHPDDGILQAVASMQTDPLGRAAVRDDEGRFIGIVSLADVARAIEVEQLAGAAAPQQRRPRFGIVLFIIGVVVAAGFWISPPYVTIAPGTAFDVTRDITVDGVEVDDVDGEYLLTSVAVQQPNLFGLIGAVLQGKPLTPLSSVVPPDVDPDEYFEEQEAIFREAQQTAAAAAARAAGLDVELTGKGAEVRSVVDGSPSDGRLRPGDIVVGIEGRDVKVSQDLSDVTRTRPAGTTFELDVVRDDRRISVEVQSRAGVVEGAPGIGVSIVTKDFEADLPFEVTFRDRDIGGPSAGLAYALAIYDMIESSDLAGGRTVGTTGTIDFDGVVGPVGGVEQKTEAALDAGATVFLVPDGEVDQVPQVEELDVIGVETLADAIEALR
jgi:PDZ domain-containing protein